jgi:triosephosphate isomerase
MNLFGLSVSQIDNFNYILYQSNLIDLCLYIEGTGVTASPQQAQEVKYNQ